MGKRLSEGKEEPTDDGDSEEKTKEQHLVDKIKEAAENLNEAISLLADFSIPNYLINITKVEINTGGKVVPFVQVAINKKLL